MLTSNDRLQKRTVDDLRILLESMTRQIQAVSCELVALMEERHELREEADMRRIAVEQFLVTSPAMESNGNDLLTMTSSYCNDVMSGSSVMTSSCIAVNEEFIRSSNRHSAHNFQ